MRTILSVENRIAKLSQKPVENKNLIKKWQRILNKIKGIT